MSHLKNEEEYEKNTLNSFSKNINQLQSFIKNNLEKINELQSITAKYHPELENEIQNGLNQEPQVLNNINRLISIYKQKMKNIDPGNNIH